MRTAALLLTAACAAPTPAPPPGCDAGCPGCCDTRGGCHAGDGDARCGRGGAACTACAAFDRCQAGVCRAASTGCPASCSGCCDDGGACRAGRTPLECGEGGQACTLCPAGTHCSAGACIAVTQCDGACGAACCPPGSCEAAPCGFDGGACATCPAGGLCSAGACGAGAPTRWRLKVVSARIAPTRPNGQPWDDKNDPDPKVCANVGDAGQVCTLEVSETFTPVWNTTFLSPYAHEQLERVELSVIDSDFPGQTVIDELGVLDLRPRWSGAPQRWSLTGGSVSALLLELEPSP